MKILLVDDEDFIRKGMCYTIPWEDYDLEVSEASNGAEALDIALRTHPDIVLTDISMPVMDGFELTRRLNQTLPDTRVLILTAYDTLDNLKEAIDVQVSGFLVKNANSQEILDTVLKLKKELEEGRRRKEKLNQVQEIFNENQMLIKSTLIYRFFKKGNLLFTLFKEMWRFIYTVRSGSSGSRSDPVQFYRRKIYPWAASFQFPGICAFMLFGRKSYCSINSGHKRQKLYRF